MLIDYVWEEEEAISLLESGVLSALIFLEATLDNRSIPLQILDMSAATSSPDPGWPLWIREERVRLWPTDQERLGIGSIDAKAMIKAKQVASEPQAPSVLLMPSDFLRASDPAYRLTSSGSNRVAH